MNFNQVNAWPDWAGHDATKIFLAGLMSGILIQITRAAIRWFKRVGREDLS